MCLKRVIANDKKTCYGLFGKSKNQFGTWGIATNNFSLKEALVTSRKIRRLFKKHHVHFTGPEDRLAPCLKRLVQQIKKGKCSLTERPHGLVLEEESVRIMILHPIYGTKNIVHMLVDGNRSTDRLSVSISGRKKRELETCEQAAHRHIKKVIKDQPYVLICVGRLTKQISGIRWLEGLPHEDYPTIFVAVMLPQVDTSTRRESNPQIENDEHEKHTLGTRYSWLPVSGVISSNPGVQKALSKSHRLLAKKKH